MDKNTSFSPGLQNPGLVRDRVWAELWRRRQVGYPLPPHGHHPNFTGAAAAAARLLQHLLETQALTSGDTVLSYPDMVLKGLRKRLLEAGISVVVPAQHGDRYRLLKSGVVDAGKASSIAGAEREGEDMATLPPLSFAFVACVAVSRTGDVLTKGYGFALPPEIAALPSATLVHPLQVLERLEPDAPPVTLYATPSEVGHGSPKQQLRQK
jgi:5-formyltetrahydrofolate cyclo-ligase